MPIQKFSHFLKLSLYHFKLECSPPCMINHTTCSTPMFYMPLVICQSRLKIMGGTHALQTTSHTLSQVNHIHRCTCQGLTNTKQPTSHGRTKRPARNEKMFTTITSLGSTFNTTATCRFHTPIRIRRGQKLF